MPVNEFFDRLLGVVNFILHMRGGFKGEPKEGAEGLKAGLLSFLNKEDEVSFDEALSELGVATLNGEGKDIILSWLQRLENSNNEEEQKIPSVFRKVITTHPEKEARIKILRSYAEEKDDTARTERFKTVTLPEWITRVLGKKWAKAVEFMAEKAEQAGPAIKADVTSCLGAMESKMQDRINDLNARRGGNNV